ncbi:MAG: ANTAR domain-containing protein [Chromatiales bacterium]|jgi:response regulator NasT
MANVWRLAIISEDKDAPTALSGLDFVHFAGHFSPDDDPESIIADETLDALLLITQGLEKVQDSLPRMAEKLPVLLFTDDDRVEQINLALKNGISSYVIRGFDPQRLEPLLKVAITRHRQSMEQHERLRRIESALTERKAIERAKGLIMQRKQCSEDVAYQAMRRLAMSTNRKIADIANDVISASGRL